MKSDLDPETDKPQFSGLDQRAASRYEFAVQCSVRLEDSHSTVGYIRNISLTGAFVELAHYDNASIVNQRIRMFFAGDIDENPFAIQLNGTIVRAVLNGVGVQFRLADREKIDEVIKLIEQEKAKKEQKV